MGAVDSGISRTLDIPGFIAKTRECSNLSVGVALKVWFSYGQYMKMTGIEHVLLQPLWWCCVDCVIHHERDVREEQHHTYMWREQAIIE